MTKLIETEWGFTTFGVIGSMQPVRKIPKNYRNVTGISAHTKAEGPAMYESSLERDLITLLEFNQEIETFTVQPVTLEWVDQAGKSRKYTPDVFFSQKNGSKSRESLLCEVKYREDLKKDWKILRPKFKAAVRFAKAQGWRFRILTEEEIRTPYLDNARFLLRYRYPTPDPAVMEIVCNRLEDMRQTTPSGLIAASFRDKWKSAQALTVLWYLVSTSQIGTDLNEPLTMASPIWWKNG